MNKNEVQEIADELHALIIELKEEDFISEDDIEDILTELEGLREDLEDIRAHNNLKKNESDFYLSIIENIRSIEQAADEENEDIFIESLQTLQLTFAKEAENLQ